MITETTYYIIVDGQIYDRGTFEEMHIKLKREEQYFDDLKRLYGTVPDIVPSELYYCRLLNGDFANKK